MWIAYYQEFDKLWVKCKKATGAEVPNPVLEKDQWICGHNVPTMCDRPASFSCNVVCLQYKLNGWN